MTHQPAATTGTPLIDTSVMPTLHTFSRRELRLAAGVIRGVAVGDRRRAGEVCDHLDFVTRSLNRRVRALTQAVPARAIHQGRHSRVALAAQFWPDVMDTSARTSLRPHRRDLRAGGRCAAAEGDRVRAWLGAHPSSDRSGVHRSRWPRGRRVTRAKAVAC
jgi:hypothetical protein